MEILSIKSEEEFELAIKRFEILFDFNIDTVEWDEAGVLALLIEAYGNKFYPIELPDPIEAMKIRMEEMQVTK